MGRTNVFVLVGVLCLCGASGVLAASEKVAPSNGAKGTSATYAGFRDAYDAGNRLLRARQFPQAVDAYTQAEGFASSPSVKSQAANAAGWTLVKARKWIQAREIFRRAVQSDPKNKVALGNLGFSALKIYQYGLGSEPDFQEALKAL